MSNKLFTSVPVPKFPRSTFNLSRPVLFAPRMHKEYATELLEVIPGDGFKAWSEAYAKSQPMVAPTFAKMDTCQEAFFVPCWQVSERFDDFITGGERGMNQDKMPFVRIGLLLNKLYVYLQNEFYCTVAGETVTENEANAYNEYLTSFQDILEGLDVCRSAPVVVPDFKLVFAGMTVAQWQTVTGANTADFLLLNGNLIDTDLRMNLLPFAIQLKVWCEFYRDENLCEDLYAMYWCGEYTDWSDTPSLDFRKVVGDQALFFTSLFANESIDEAMPLLHSFFGLKSRAWKKDYFTSALPFVQKGPDVVLPIDAGIQFYSDYPGTYSNSIAADKPSSGSREVGLVVTGDRGPIYGRISEGSIGTTIQDVRTAFKLEEMYEADGRFGSRYPENTLGQFGVRTPDSRLPRCQFLGRSSQPVQIQQVVQDSQTDETPQGNLAGLANSYGSNKLFKSYQSQHGFIVCFTCIRVHALYQQGIHPMFSRYDRTEYAWPRFAHLGEEPIYTKQLFVDDTVQEDEVFGYTPRYASYKSDTGSIHGPLKNSLNFWTMARRFANKPVLNEEFIYSRPRQDAFVVTNHLQPVFIMEIDYHIRANRVLPFYGIPHL